MKRVLEGNETLFAGASNEMVQFALKTSSPRIHSTIIKNFQQMVLGLKLRREENFLIHKTEPPKVVKLPSHIQSLQQASDWAYFNCTVPHQESLASLSFNNQIIVLNANHAICDGRILTNYLRQCLNEKIDQFPQFPESSQSLFKDKLNCVEEWDRKNDELATFPIDPNRRSNQTHAVFFEIPFSSLICCRDGKCHGLTDSLFTSAWLAMSSFKGKLMKTSTRTAVDLRRYLNHDSFSYVNIFAAFNIRASGVTPKSTVGELASKFRLDFEKGVRQYAPLWDLKARDRKFPGSKLTVSNIGNISLPKGIDDVWVQSIIKGNAADNTLAILSFSRRDQLVVRLRYGNGCLGDTDAEKLMAKMKIAMQKIPLSTTLEDAISKLGNVQ